MVRESGGIAIEGFGFAVAARTVRDSLPALRAGSQLGSSAGPTPTPRLGTASRSGPVDGAIEHKADDLIDLYRTGVNASNFSAVATFENPYPRSVGGWDYGFLFRNSTGNTFHIVIVTDDRRWFHYLREGSVDDQRLVGSGSVPSLQTGQGAWNEVRIIADEDEGLLLVNGELVEILDLTEGPSRGSVYAFTGYFNDNVVPGYSTRFREFAIGELWLISERSGALHHTDDDFIEQFNIGTSISDFMVIATFTNPYSSLEGTWDYGIAFRDDASVANAFHAVTVNSNGWWEYFVREGSTTPTHEESGTTGLNDSEGAQNKLFLVVAGDTALFSVNGALVTTLDISRGSQTRRRVESGRGSTSIARGLAITQATMCRFGRWIECACPV